MANFLSPLELEYLDGRNWRVTAEFDYHVGAPNSPDTVCIPVGFITDFASIPKFLWNILPPTGSYGKAAVVHDWLYRDRVISHDQQVGSSRVRTHVLCDRQEADGVLLEAMQVLGTGYWTRHIIWLAVRLFGWAAWEKYDG